MDIEGLVERWNLTEIRRCGTVYRALFEGNAVVLKSIETNAVYALEAFDGRGAVKLLRYSNDAYLAEWIEGPLLASLPKQEIWKEAAAAVSKLHHAPPDPRLPSLHEVFQPLFRADDPLSKRAAETARELLAQPQGPEVSLHGDLHPENLVHDRERGWLAIDPKGMRGERTYDYANFFFNPPYSDPKHLATVFARVLEVTPLRVLKFAFAYGALSALWCVEDEVDPEPRRRICHALLHAGF